MIAIDYLIELKAEEFAIELLSRNSVFNSNKLQGELRILRSLPNFVRGLSNKTIHQWLEKLLRCKNFVNVHKAFL